MKVSIHIECSSVEEAITAIDYLSSQNRPKPIPSVVKDDLDQNLGKWIDDRKRDLGFTYQEVADKSDLSLATVYNAARGKALSQKTRRKLIAALDEE